MSWRITWRKIIVTGIRSDQHSIASSLVCHTWSPTSTSIKNDLRSHTKKDQIGPPSQYCLGIELENQIQTTGRFPTLFFLEILNTVWARTLSTILWQSFCYSQWGRSTWINAAVNAVISECCGFAGALIGTTRPNTRTVSHSVTRPNTQLCHTVSHNQTHNSVTVSTPERCRALQTELAGVVWPAERVASELRKRKVANLVEPCLSGRW